MMVFWTFSSDKEAGESPALPRNCKGNENHEKPLVFMTGKVRQVGCPEPGYLSDEKINLFSRGGRKEDV